MSALDQASARRIAGILQRVKCDGDHGGPRCADPECWNGGRPQAAEAPVYVVVCENDKPHPRWGVDPGGAIVHETYTNAATLEHARKRAAAQERWGACRIARLVFTDDEGRPL